MTLDRMMHFYAFLLSENKLYHWFQPHIVKILGLAIQKLNMETRILLWKQF